MTPGATAKQSVGPPEWFRSWPGGPADEFDATRQAMVAMQIWGQQLRGADGFGPPMGLGAATDFEQLVESHFAFLQALLAAQRAWTLATIRAFGGVL